jgi:hypothetical protein
LKTLTHRNTCDVFTLDLLLLFLPPCRKYRIQKLTDVGNGKWPVYYYENIEGGHGGAADAKQSAFMLGLAYDFMYETLSRNAAATATCSAVED